MPRRPRKPASATGSPPAATATWTGWSARASGARARRRCGPRGRASSPSASTTAPPKTRARRGDYHERIRGKLKRLGQWLVANAGGELKVFVDTAPVMEKPLAAAAGLGWQGKHTNLVSAPHGSGAFS